MQGHYRHAQAVLSQLAPDSLATRLTVQQQAVRRLALPHGTAPNATARWHRDGLLFGVTPPFVKNCTLRTENTRRTRMNPSSLE